MSQPFSRVYCTPDAAQQDSVRMRRRIGRYISDFSDTSFIVERIERETGARVPYTGYVNLDSFFQTADLRDVLDSITHVYSALLDNATIRSRYVSESDALKFAAAQWRTFVGRVLAEEHTTYELDAECNVRYAVDEAYALNRRATLSRLGSVKWEAVRAEFERAFGSMDDVEQDTNAAIRAIAAAVEACGKLFAANGISRLGPAEIEKSLWPIVQAIYANDVVAANASHQVLNSLAQWTNATHQYRHGQGSDAEVRAPTALAIQMLTSGAGFIRWMIDMDEKRA